MVGQLTEKIRHAAAKKQLRLSVDIDRECTEFVTDRNKLQLILVNLLNNAVNFTPGGKKAGIKLHCRPDEITVVVEDEGIGMSPEEKDRIFERFHRANPKIQSVSPGSGLGLAVVEGLLFLLQGKIEVETAMGKGTTIKVTIPKMNPQEIEFEDDLFFDDEENEESF